MARRGSKAGGENFFARVALALAVGVASVVLLWGSGLAKIIGNLQYDMEMRSLVRAESARGSAHGQRESAPEIILVLIDQSSLAWVEENLGLGWPWPRELYGVMAQYLRNAAVQAWDILLTEVSQYGVEDDTRCTTMMQEAGNVILARLPGRRPVIGLPNEQLAHVNAAIDLDGVVRRYPAWIDFGNERLPSLGLRSVAALVGESNAARIAEAGPGGKVLLRFRPSASFIRYSAAQILAAALTGGPSSPDLPAQERFRGAAVLVGISAPGMPDRQAVPVDAAMPGVEIHATYIENALRDGFVRELPVGYSIAVAVLMAAAAASLPLVGRKASKHWFVPVLLGVWGTVQLLGHVLFRYGTWLGTIAGLIPAMTTLVASLVLAYRYEGRQRAYLRKAFAQYLAPEVIAELLDNPSRLNLGGDRRNISVLFSDMAGFTQVSERLEPDKLAAFMNHYLGILSEEIMAAGGTLDKYIGDAVVAFWNAPLQIQNHAERAVSAAIRIQERLSEATKSLYKEFGFAPRTRIGIATGEAIVGNLGSSQRFAYTAVGDAVNIASRLEAACKLLDAPILVDRPTVAHCWAVRYGGQYDAFPEDLEEMRFGPYERIHVSLVRLGLAQVEGKTVPVELWTAWPIPGGPEKRPEPWQDVKILPK